MMWVWIGLGVVVVLVVAFLLWKRFANRDDGPVSLVIYRTTYRDITEADARGAARRALGVNAEVQTIPFDENTKGLLLMAEEFPPVAIITSNRTYIDPDNIELAAKECEDPILRNAVLTHKSWLSVDAMGMDKLPANDIRLTIYNGILGKILAEFIDDQSLVIFAPAEGLYGQITPDTASLLTSGKITEILGDSDLNAPIIQRESTDEAINKAIATAQKRLPEFINIIESGRAEAQPIVKARFAASADNAEHMWAKAQSVSSAGIVAEIMNRPADPTLPKKGEVVTIKLDDVSDWMYINENQKPVGGFVERVLKNG